MRFWLALTLLIAIPLSPGTLRIPDEARFWAESGLDEAFVRRLINDQVCASTPLYSQACAAALPEAGGNYASAVARIAAQARNLAPEAAYGRVVDRLVKEFDPHARFLPTAQADSEHSLAETDYAGIGILNSTTGAGLFVRQVFSGSPAEAADLRPGDRIVGIDGLAAGDGARLAGPVGSRFRLDIERNGRLLEKKIQIATVVRRFVEARVLQEHGRRTGYVRLTRFVHGVCEMVRARLLEMRATDGWILDLRGNPGGLMDEAKCLAGHLIGGVARVVGERALRLPLPAPLGLQVAGDDAEIEWEMSWNGGELRSKPLVVLIDQNSASSAEIVAAAVQDYGRALIVGERSFGKGSAQVAEALADRPGLTVVHTVSTFYRPSGPGLQRRGVTPDIEAAAAPGAGTLERRVAREGEIFRRALPAQPASLVFEVARGFARPIRACIARRLRDPARWRNSSADNQLNGAIAAFLCQSET